MSSKFAFIELPIETIEALLKLPEGVRIIRVGQTRQNGLDGMATLIVNSDALPDACQMNVGQPMSSIRRALVTYREERFEGFVVQ